MLERTGTPIFVILTVWKDLDAWQSLPVARNKKDMRFLNLFFNFLK